MTAARATALPESLDLGWGSGATVSLAAVEARRILLNPAYLPALGYGLLVTGVDFGHGISQVTRASAAEFIGILASFFFPLVAIFAASLVATSARRAGAEEMLGALPVTARTRSAALLLAGLAPAAVGAIGAGTAWYLERGIAAPHLGLSGGAFAAIPLLYLGVGALAVAAARWLPWPGAPLALMVALVLWVTHAHGSSHAAAVLTAPWIVAPDTGRAIFVAGYSDVWHLVYLSGLVGLAATAALFRDDLRRMIVIGTAIGLPTLLAAWAQLP